MDKKNLLLVVSGGIASYKVCEIASYFTQRDVNVDVVMTKNATEFVRPLTFEALTKNKCRSSLFDSNNDDPIAHVSLARKADVVLVAPATADIIAKIANGIADDLASSTVLACTCKKIIAPAMYCGMFENPATQRNIHTLENDGWQILNPSNGRLACGAVGTGRLCDVSDIISAVEEELYDCKKFDGKKILVTAGATQERLDPVRYITNHSTGKMGYALAKVAKQLGANVTLVTGKTNLEIPYGVHAIQIESAKQMYDAVMKESESTDIFVMAAAVADYTPSDVSPEKIKKSDSDFQLKLVRTKDILSEIGNHKKEGQYVIGFSMETENLLENSRKKLTSKKADMIVANSISSDKTGFGTDTNKAILIMESEEMETELVSKEELARIIFDKIK